MTTAREVMSADPTTIGEADSLIDAARLMRDLDVGALPICDEYERLTGILTDRDIVVRCLANGGDPAQTIAGSLAEGKPVTIDVDADIRDALTLMENNQIRRLPVVSNQRLVGIIAQADIALSLSATETGETVEAISE